MISRWQLIFRQAGRKLWFRATLFALAAVVSALASIVFKSAIPPSVSVKVGADAVDNILNILASSMLAVTTFSLSTMVTAFGSATTHVTPRATKLVVEDSTTQNVLATFIGSFLFSLVGIIALNMGAYGEQGRVILFAVTLVVIALILVTLLRWIHHLTSLGSVDETTSRVERMALDVFSARAQSPCFGARPWRESDRQPAGTFAVYSDAIGYVQHIDMDRLHKAMTDSPVHVYLVAQPGFFVHPARPVMYVTHALPAEQRKLMLSALTIAASRTFAQDPRFCLCVMAEIASRALSPATNDPGTAIDVIGRAVRILSCFARECAAPTVIYPAIHVAPLSVDALFDDFFSPVARDGAAIKEVQLRLLKALGMLSVAWPDAYQAAALRHAHEAMAYLAREAIIQTDRARIERAWREQFGADYPHPFLDEKLSDSPCQKSKSIS
ncbi:DUF2254 domain-containing protein [Pantoea ananatis]|uniref:DUF2254 domain-containing protein n=1 Tax=Pantoea ananas TaxID=553 RepID=UPI002223473A|nr:DUF2254 domain-containing protein [Pantoea ananatis]MCW1832670.1 DUF2254 domain-containing protein [Pantoea ananatis]